jgi:type II secretory pathway component PulJ
MQEMRRAAAEGRLTPELQSAYLLAVRDLRQAQAAAARQDLPTALEIRARRGQPGREQAVILYENGRAQDLFRGHPALPRSAPADASAAQR